MSQSLGAKDQAAWYADTRTSFLVTTNEIIANQLAGRAAAESLQIEAAQNEEWQSSVALLQRTLNDRIPILRRALATPECESIRHVVLEFDFRRRGLRMDCLLLGDGILFVIEFKRSKLQRADRDQVMNYAVNLVEFHRSTQEWCQEGCVVVPILARTDGDHRRPLAWPGMAGPSWPSVARGPMECDKDSLQEALALGLRSRRTEKAVALEDWLKSSFRPSSSIVDATLSLYGNHDVSAIQDHSAPQEAIESSTREIRQHISEALGGNQYHIVFLSGAPGAGKTLVGLDLVMRGPHAAEAVFVTGNAPLVDVLNKALGASYRAQGQRAASWTPTGYPRSDAALVTTAAGFKVVKAHNFLGPRGHSQHQEDGRVVVFDEAQRTYEKGRVVLGNKLEDHEADLILSAQKTSFPSGGSVVVALIGHNQAINRGERGIIAWLDAAERLGWSFSIADETLALAEFQDREKWAMHPLRSHLMHGHLSQSMRYYRNSTVEEWAGRVLAGDAPRANLIAETLHASGDTIWLTRSLESARRWARGRVAGGQRCGLIASGQARRLAAEGLFVGQKPDIADWMLAPTSDIRSSNALETVQNQYQIQGLELDFSIVCWDADLRRENGTWMAYKMAGSDWRRDTPSTVAENGYRVLLTRARQGMAIFVPKGDLSGEDVTRDPAFYGGTWEFLRTCGARELRP